MTHPHTGEGTPSLVSAGLRTPSNPFSISLTHAHTACVLDANSPKVQACSLSLSLVFSSGPPHPGHVTGAPFPCPLGGEAEGGRTGVRAVPFSDRPGGSEVDRLPLCGHPKMAFSPSWLNGLSQHLVLLSFYADRCVYVGRLASQSARGMLLNPLKGEMSE